MAFVFSFSGTEYRLTQTGTDTNLTGIATAVAAVPAVARSTAYTVGTIRKPPTKNGMWYRCSVAGTTSATAPTFGLTAGSSTVDGTATFIAFREPEIYVMGNVTEYVIPEATLYVSGGTLTIDPRVNMLSGIVNIYPVSGGTLNCGVQFTSTYGGGTLYSQGVAIQFSGILYESPGTTFNLRGATMHSTKTIQAVHEFNGTTYIRNGYWLGQPGNNSRLRLNSANTDVDYLYVYGTQCDTLMTPTASTIIKNVKSMNVGVGIDNALAGGAGSVAPFIYDGVPSTIGNVSTGYSNWTGLNNLQLINCEAGSLEMIMPDNCGNTGTSGFGGRIYQKYQISVQNTLGASIPNAITYLKDTNNGKRKIKNVRNATPIDNLADQVQILTTDATGKTPVTQVLTSYVYRNNSVGDIGQPDGNEIRDLRGKIDTAGSDLFDVILFEYDYAITPIVDIAMKGLLNVVAGSKMLIDSNKTLPKIDADALIGVKFEVDDVNKKIRVIGTGNIDNVLYDASKAFKCTNNALNLSLPTIDKLLVTAKGKSLEIAEDWDLEIATGVSLTKGAKFKEVILKGTGLLTNNGTIDFPFTDALGSRVAVTNLDPEGFGVTWYLRFKKTTATTWINVSGTGNNATILMDLDTYTIMARVPGYDWKTIEVDTNESLGIDLNLSYQVSANNTPQYTMSFDAALEASIQYDATKMAVAVENTTGAITQPGFAELYRATQRIQHIPALVWVWTHPVTANATSQKILIPDGNPISFFLTEASTASVKVTCPVIHLSSGESADDRVKGNSTGYSIILGSPATAESAGLQSAIVSDIMAKLGGAGYSIENDNLKKINEKVQTLENADLTGIATIENVLDSNTAILEAISEIPETDISALALEATSQDIKTKVDTLSNYNDAALVAKVDAIKSVVDNVKTTVEDKTGYSLTSAQVEAIATAVESHLLNDGDSQQLINAIVTAIGNSNVDETILVAAIRADIERTGGKLEAVKTKVDILHNADFTDTNALIIDLGYPLQSDNYVAPDNASIASVKTTVEALHNYDDSILIGKVDNVKTKVDGLENYSDTELQGKVDAVKTKVDGLENFDGSSLSNKIEAISPKLEKMNEGLQLISNFEPYDGDL